MKFYRAFAVGPALLVSALVTQSSDQMETMQLKTLVEGMGYETKMINSEKGKEKFEFTIKTDSHNIPIGGEVSPSKNYIWFTVFLGESAKSQSRHTELLRENAKIQPNFFYITSTGNLMLACATDNRGITAAVVKRITDKLAGDVSKTASIWQ